MENNMQDSTEENARLLLDTTLWTRNFVLLCLVNMALFMSIQVLLPTLPLYLFKIGGSQQDIGFAMGAFTICAMVIRPIAGWLVDAFGRKKIITMGLILILAVSGLYRLSTAPIMIIAVRGLHGLAFGIAGTAVGTILVDSLPPKRMTEGMGYFGLTASLSMAVAPIIGFWLSDNMGYSTLFLWIIVMSLAALLISLPVKGTNIPLRTSARSIKGIWVNLFEKTSIPASSVMFMIAAVYGSVLSFISLYASESGIKNVGLFFTAMAVSMLISRPISGRWADHGGTDKVLCIGFLAMSIGLINISLSHTIDVLMTAGAVFGFGIGFCIPTLQAKSVRYVPAQKRGAATATFFIALDLGIGLGTIIWGYVAGATSYQIMYLTALIPVILAGVIYYKLRVHGY